MLLALWLIVTLVLSSMPLSGPSVVEHQDKFGHFAMYGLGAILFFRELIKRLPAHRALAASVLASTLYGCLMEAIQAFIPYRQASLADAFANGAGALVFCFIYKRWRGHEA